MSTIVWIVLVALYVTALIVLGAATLRRGHYVLFGVGIFFPIVWVVGAMIPPAPRAAGTV